MISIRSILLSTALAAPVVADAQGVSAPGWCSAATLSGDWAFAWRDTTQFQACQRVRQYLGPGAQISGGLRQGVYGAFGFNQVYVRCDVAMSRTFSGMGERPLQQAYDWAVSGRGQRCQFNVYPMPRRD